VDIKGEEHVEGMERTLRMGWCMIHRALVGVVVSSWLVSTVLAQGDIKPSEADLAAGKQLYEARCMHCHGEAGDGQGVSAEVVYPKPRDFTSGVYKFRTRHETEQGNKLAADEDIFRSISEGLHGTSMPGWVTFFTKQQITQLVQYIKTFAPVYAEDKPGAKLDFGGEAPSSPESIARGKEHFTSTFECYTCHGMSGRGNGQQALDGLVDDWGERIWPANLTQPWTYRGGMSRQDIFRNIALGINGTPMPAFGDFTPLDAELRQQIWDTVNYVQSLWTHAAEPEVKSVLVAKRVEGALPTTPDDAAWKTVPANYYPLVGQVIEEPRLFNPMIVGIEVQAVHNGKEIAFRLVWDDRTESQPGESNGTETYADAVALQFPSQYAGETERPYFLMGDSTRPTDLWYWRNNPGTAVLVQTTGYKSFQPGDDTGGIQSQGLFDDGQYRVVMKRSLQTKNADKEIQFAIGQFLIISMTAWDGSNGEHGGGKRTVTAWYNLYLEPAASQAPLYLMLVGIVVGVLIEFSALYVTRKNHANVNAMNEKRGS
jgi:DMSO reductase family type II enzyme heme b subunit